MKSGETKNKAFSKAWELNPDGGVEEEPLCMLGLRTDMSRI